MDIIGLLLKVRIALFPDAPTIRGKKHIDELTSSAQKDYKNYLVFIIQMKGVDCFKPNDDMDLKFGISLRKANAMHVKIRAYDCLVTNDSIKIDKPVKILL